MDKSIIFEKVKKIVAENLEIEPCEVTLNTDFTEHGGTIDDYYAKPWWERSISNCLYMDIDKIEIIMALEEEFDIEIPDEDAEDIKTVQQVVDYIYKKLVV
ncbi:acyl carrier protein [Microcoleus sp. ARI1-B5]|uniref:acyl carrier protein n=1 Tax=unclassified Microcoleus TaxID=2642155 RepID=UPI002FD735B5